MDESGEVDLEEVDLGGEGLVLVRVDFDIELLNTIDVLLLWILGCSEGHCGYSRTRKFAVGGETVSNPGDISLPVTVVWI